MAVSQFTLMRKNSHAVAEVDDVRQRYGHVRVKDPEKIYVVRIPQNPDSFRFVFPKGARYMVHLTDANYKEFRESPVPSKTIALNDLSDGGDFVLTIRVNWENNAPRARIYTNSEEFFDYIPNDWAGSEDPHQTFYLQTNPEADFSINETITLFWWREPIAGRALIVWLEPRDVWWERRERRKELAEPSD